MSVRQEPKIYHIVHVDRLPSIIAHGCLWCDAIVAQHSCAGTMIGMNAIKQRRLENTLRSHPNLHVGDCVPFYFCPRSIMLYVIHRANHPDLNYRGGQAPIIHLQADLHTVVRWAKTHGKRWAFTTSNAGSNYFEDYAELGQLDKLDWTAISTDQWGGPSIDSSVKEGKQAEFLLEHSLPWELVEKIGVLNENIRRLVTHALVNAAHKPTVAIMPDWYY